MSVATEVNRAETNAAYHADFTAVSRSMLATFRDRRRLFYREYIQGIPEERKSTTPMDIGTLAHAGLLEPERFDELYAVYPVGMLAANGAVSTKAAKAFRDEHAANGVIAVKQHDLDNVRRMVDSVREKVKHWLDAPHVIEQPIYWEDAETGVKCRIKPDWLIPLSSGPIILDVKGTNDVSPAKFKNRVRDNALWLQDAHYSEGVAVHLGLPVEDVEFYFLAVDMDQPFTTALHDLRPHHRQAARDVRYRLLNELIACQDSGDWSDPFERDINPVDIHDSVIC